MKSILKYSFIFLGIFILSITVRILLFDIFLVSSNSMKPALQPGDIIWVNKLSLGPKLPSTPYEIPWVGTILWLANQKGNNLSKKVWVYNRLSGFAKINAGDVIVFSHPRFRKIIVKRCVGLPGDSVIITDSGILINKKNILHNPIEYSWLSDVLTINELGFISIPKQGETIALNFKTYPCFKMIIRYSEGVNIQERNNQYLINNIFTTKYTFQQSYFFMIGDNRNNSLDSRQFGPIPEENIIGKATLVLLNYHNGKFRWDRFFKKIE